MTNIRTAPEHVSTDMDQVHTPTEGRITHGQHQQKLPQIWIKFTHKLRAEKYHDSISTIFPTWIKFTYLLRVGKHRDHISTNFQTCIKFTHLLRETSVQ